MSDENSLTANGLYFEQVEDEQGMQLTLEESLRNNFVGLLMDRYEQAESARDIDERRWLTAYHNYRGLYDKNALFVAAFFQTPVQSRHRPNFVLAYK